MEQLTGDVLNINIEYADYQTYKAAVDAELQRSAEGFVRIGYLLKVARDTDILKGSGYGGVNEFAEAEYSLDKSQVSRFIRINDEFSEDGYSDRLQERYQRFGYAKLALMLMLPAAVNEELTADYTKKEIQTIKEEIDEENQRTDIEVMLEEKDGRQQEYDLLGKVLYQLWHDKPETYITIHGTIRNMEYTEHEKENRVAEILAPAGEKIISVRIAGEGKKLLSLKGTDTAPVVVDVRSAVKTACTWGGLMSDISKMCNKENPEENWTALYGEDFPEQKEEVAPVQPAQDRQPPKKPQRVTISRPEKPRKTGEDSSRTEEKKPEEKRELEGQKGADAGVSETERDQNRGYADQNEKEDGTDTVSPAHDIPAGEENAAGNRPADDSENAPEPGNVPDGAGAGGTEEPAGDHTDAGTDQPAAGPAEGQLNITDYPEYLPDSVAAEQHIPQYVIKGYLDALRDNLDRIYTLTEGREYGRAEEYIEAVRGTIQKIREMRRD